LTTDEGQGVSVSAENVSDDLDRVIEQQHQALDEFARGDHEPLGRLWSQRDDVSLGNPFGPFVTGFPQVMETMGRAAANYQDGKAVGFDLVAKEVTPDLAYVVEVERFTAKVGGREEATPLALRCTSIFRREDGVWKLVHRHADPITSTRPPESVIES
jgi:ketosteroid isomerase-like protein